MKVIFITREGYKLSGARVRCYNFAQELRRYGVETEVHSFADNLGAEFAEAEAGMSILDKFRYNLKSLKLLLKENKDEDIYVTILVLMDLAREY